MPSPFHSLTYGLFLLSASADGRHNACIINTAQQVTSSPATISISVSKDNLTHDMIRATGRFALSVLTEDAPFELFRRFGMQSGRNTDKFDGFSEAVGNCFRYQCIVSIYAGSIVNNLNVFYSSTTCNSMSND